MLFTWDGQYLFCYYPAGDLLENASLPDLLPIEGRASGNRKHGINDER